jgi:hypothetical protein
MLSECEQEMGWMYETPHYVSEKWLLVLTASQLLVM